MTLARAQFGMFVSDDESNLCYLNPGSLGMEDDFWLVGVVVGLAVYNAATLDVPLPLVSCFPSASLSPKRR